MKPKLLVLTSTFPRSVDDYEPRFVADLCTHLKSEFDVNVLTQHRPRTPTNEEFEGIKVKRFRYAPCKLEILSESGGISNTLSNNLWSWLLVPMFIVAQIQSIRSQIKTIKPDIIHSHWLIPQTLSAIIALKLSSHKPPLVSTSHGADIFRFHGKLLSKLKIWGINRCSKFCVVSTSMKDHLKKTLNIENVSICPMGANIDTLFAPGKQQERKPNQLLYMGRLVKKKGVENLLHALPLLNKHQDTFSLVVAGYGPEIDRLKLLSSKLGQEPNVVFTGSLTHREMAVLCKQSHICIFPFVESDDGDIEGLGLVIIEAMGCKCPVIVGNVPAITDLVAHNQTGLICNPRIVTELADSILRLANDPKLCRQLTNNAYTFVHKNFSWKISAERYSQLFKKLMARKSIHQ